MNSDIKKAVEILKSGGIVIFPTDTAFGIGCVIDDEKAVKRLFAIRKRPKDQATPVLADTVKMAEEYVGKIPKDVLDLLTEPYWPGALTMILHCIIERVPRLVRGGGATLGVRIPNHPVARAIIRGVGKPILGPSANFHGGKTPFTLDDLDPDLVSLVDYVVAGKTSLQKASTVIDCTVSPWRIVRKGAVKIQKSKIKEQKHKSKFKNSIIVSINTSSNEEITVGLEINGKRDIITQKIGPQKSQIVLPLIEKLLKKHRLGVEDIGEIRVNEGPGSFTGLRVGISIANALSFSLKIPVNAKKPGIFVSPRYF